MELIKLTKQNEDFGKFKFAARATSRRHGKDNKFSALSYLNIEDGLIVGCDGHRIHCAMLTGGYEDGLYEVEKNTQTAIIAVKTSDTRPYPDWVSLFPAWGQETRQVQTFCENLNNPGRTSLAYVDLLKIMDGNVINFHNIEDAAQEHYMTWSFYAKTNFLQPVSFYNNTYFGLIMPLRSSTD